jgi:hypothetical protein
MIKHPLGGFFRALLQTSLTHDYLDLPIRPNLPPWPAESPGQRGLPITCDIIVTQNPSPHTQRTPLPEGYRAWVRRLLRCLLRLGPHVLGRLQSRVCAERLNFQTVKHFPNEEAATGPHVTLVALACSMGHC